MPLAVAQLAECFHVLPSDVLEKDAAMTRVNFEAARQLWEWKNEMRRIAEEEAKSG
jgi:hypothetical protein